VLQHDERAGRAFGAFESHRDHQSTSALERGIA
jgi:hypothetical protein